MLPVCLVCGDCGHLAGTCLKHLSLLKEQGKLQTIPQVTSTQYHFGQVCDVCPVDVMMVDDDADDDQIERSKYPAFPLEGKISRSVDAGLRAEDELRHRS
jgi:hypothetical protein